MATYCRTILYLGNRAEADYCEGVGNAIAEDLSRLKGHYTQKDGLAVKETVLHDQSSVNYDYCPNGAIEEDHAYNIYGHLLDKTTQDCVVYMKNGQRVETQLDNVQLANVKVTLHDGTVCVINKLVLTQMKNGDVFLNEHPDCPDTLDCLKIKSVEVISIDTTSYSGWYIPPDIHGSCVICFAEGTMIDTPDGGINVAELCKGSQVLTADNGRQTVRWIGKRHLSAQDLRDNPQNRPIRIRARALGGGLPKNDLVVSPQHRVLVRSMIAQRMFGTIEVLAAAKQLLELEGVDIATDLDEVTYVHFFCACHEIVYAEGLPTETLYPGRQTLKTLDPAAMEELFSLFPLLRMGDVPCAPARVIAQGRRARKMVMRHIANRKALMVA